jgi:hypothetical protein
MRPRLSGGRGRVRSRTGEHENLVYWRQLDFIDDQREKEGNLMEQELY